MGEEQDEQIIGTSLPHADFGAPDCCGCLNGIPRGGTADIVCNECSAVIKTVPVDQLRQALDAMEASLDVASAICPPCEAVHLAPGFSQLLAFICDNCGEAVTTAK
jgi:hypothetical protein